MKRRVIDEGDSVHEEMDATFGSGQLRHYRETIEPLRDVPNLHGSRPIGSGIDARTGHRGDVPERETLHV